MKIAAFLVMSLFISAGSDSALAGENSPEFTLRKGFSGRSEGRGILRLLLSKPRPFRVESYGYDQADGSFRLDQTVSFQGEPSSHRSWRIDAVRPNHYRGTLSDAAGSVTGMTKGSQLFLKYRIKGPLMMRQKLKLQPDGKTIENVGMISLLGIPVGRLEETITKEG